MCHASLIAFAQSLAQDQLFSFVWTTLLRVSPPKRGGDRRRPEVKMTGPEELLPCLGHQVSIATLMLLASASPASRRPVRAQPLAAGQTP